MEIVNKNKNLINLLITRTRERKLSWTITSKPNKYVLFLEASQLFVESTAPRIGFPAYEFSIADRFGNTIEKIVYESTSLNQDFQNIKTLYDAIKINVDIKVGLAIDSIISEIG